MFDVMRMAKLAPLLNRSLSSLSMEELRDIGDTLGLKVRVTDELRDAALALLKGKSLDTVSDLVQQPESIRQLVTFLKGGVKSIADAETENHPDYEGVQALTLTFY